MHLKLQTCSPALPPACCCCPPSYSSPYDCNLPCPKVSWMGTDVCQVSMLSAEQVSTECLYIRCLVSTKTRGSSAQGSSCQICSSCCIAALGKREIYAACEPQFLQNSGNSVQQMPHLVWRGGSGGWGIALAKVDGRSFKASCTCNLPEGQASSCAHHGQAQAP